MSEKKSVAVMLGDGFEPVEAIGPVDVLRRGGVDVVAVSVMGRRDVIAAQGVSVNADANLENVNLGDFDAVLVPGGSVGVQNLGKSEALAEELRSRMGAGRMVAAICAGPTILADLGLLNGRKAVCYPGCETGFPVGVYQAGLDVCVDGSLITATGPGTALPFGVAVLRALCGDQVADNVAQAMLL